MLNKLLKKNETKNIKPPSNSLKGLKFKHYVATTVDKFWDLVSPDGVGLTSREDDYVTIKQSAGETVYARPMHIPSEGYSNLLSTGWFQELINKGEIDVMVDIHKLTKAESVKMYQNQIKALEANISVQQMRASRETINDLRTKIADLTALMEEIQLDLNDGFFIGTNMIVYAESLRDLNEKCNRIEDDMANKGFKLVPTYRRVLKGLKTMTPLYRNQIPESQRNFDRRALSTMAPFISGSGFYNGGINVGVNKITGEKEFFNAFGSEKYRPKNYNMAIFGLAGSGKSVALKLIMARETVGMGVYTRQLDIEGEFVKTTSKLGGLNLPISEESDIRINPLHINASIVPLEDMLDGNDIDEEIAALEASDDREIIEKNGERFVHFVAIREKIHEAVDFFDVLYRGKNQEKEGLNVFEIDYLNRTLSYLYYEDERFQFTSHPNSLYTYGTAMVNGDIVQGRAKKLMPTLTDVYEYLVANFAHEPEAKKLIATVRSFLRNSPSPIFDGQTFFGEKVGTDLNKFRIVNFNLKHIEEGYLRPIAYHVILTYIWEDFIKSPELMTVPKVVNCDEFAQFVDSKQTVAFSEKLARRIRKRHGAFRIASQDFVKVANSPEARAILQNTTTYMFFEQTKIDLKQLEETFNLSQGEIDIINNSPEIGECVFKQGQSSVWMRTDPSPFEMEFVESNAAHLKRKTPTI